MEIGKKWAYREKAHTVGAPIFPVEILQFGPPRSQKVRVKFLNGEYPGLDEWTNRVRLRVLWSEVDAWLRDEQRFEAAREASMDALDIVEHRAAQHVFDLSPFTWTISAGYNYKHGAIVQVRTDFEGVATELNLDPDDLLSEPPAFVDRQGVYVAPWPVTKRLAQRVAEVHAQTLLRQVSQDQRELEEGTIRGRIVYYGRGESYSMSREHCRESLERDRPMFEVIRQWCGAPAVAYFDEVNALQTEISRLRDIVSEAARRLDPHHPRVAGRLRKQLEDPDA